MRTYCLRVVGIALVAAILGVAGAALAEGWQPKRPVEVVAPAGPGGGWDRLARLVQRVCKEDNLTSKPLRVSNKPGGGGATAWTYIKGKEGKGEYLTCTSSLILLNNILGSSPLMYSDFTSMAIMQTEWEVVAVAADSPWQNLDDFFAAIKEDPNSVAIGCGPSLGNDDHVQLLMLAEKAGVDPAKLKFVVYPECAATELPALMGGHIQAITVSYGECLEQYKAGTIRFLGVSSPERVKTTPKVPTYREQGYDVVFGHWRGMMAPPGLTPEMTKYWGDVLRKVAESDLYKKTMETEGMEPYFLGPEETTDFLAEQFVMYKKLLDQVGLSGKK